MKLATLPMERREPGEVEAIPTKPVLLMIARSEGEEVAVPATVVVAKYRFPPAFLKAHCATPAPAERASWGAVAENGFRSQVGVEVPMPKRPADVIRMPVGEELQLPMTRLPVFIAPALNRIAWSPAWRSGFTAVALLFGRISMIELVVASDTAIPSTPWPPV